MHLQQLVRGGVSNLFGWVATFAASILSWAILARHLGVTSLGEYGYALWLSNTFSALATLGLPFAAERNIGSALGRGDLRGALVFSKKLLKVQLLIGSGVALVAILVQVLISLQSNRIVIFLVAVTVIPSSIQIALRSIFSGFHRFGMANLVAAAAALFQLALIVGATQLHGGIDLMLLANLLASLGATFFFFRQLWRMEKEIGAAKTVEGNSGGAEALWRFSLTFSYVALLEYILWDRSEVFFLQRFSTYGQIAFYTIAFAAAAKLIAVAQSFADTMLPIAARVFGNSSTSYLGNMYVDANRLMLLVLVPLSGTGALLARPFVTLVYGAQFSSAVVPLQVLLAGVPVASLSAVGWAVIAAAKHESFLARGMTAGAVLSIVADYFLIRRYGAIGAACATTCAQIFIAILFLWYATGVARSQFPWSTLFRSYAASALVFAPGLWFQSNLRGLSIATCLGGCAYPIAMLMMKEYESSDLRKVVGFLSQID
jgi:O-antigen/teichoic acid export membrane protein